MALVRRIGRAPRAPARGYVDNGGSGAHSGVGTKCLETLGNLPATVDGPINIQRKRTASDVAK